MVLPLLCSFPWLFSSLLVSGSPLLVRITCGQVGSMFLQRPRWVGSGLVRLSDWSRPSLPLLGAPGPCQGYPWSLSVVSRFDIVWVCVPCPLCWTLCQALSSGTRPANL